MPPRYSYWTIIAGGLPTAFRAAERDELMPTFQRLREKHPDAEMKWFARGKLWDSPEAARPPREYGQPEGGPPREGDRRRPPAGRGEHRGRDWRPGGEHRDPRQPFKDAKKARNQRWRDERFARKQGDGERRERTPREKPHGDPLRHEAAPRFTPREGDGPRGPKGFPRDRDRRPDDRARAPRPPKADWQARPPREKPHGDALRRDAAARFAPREGDRPRGPKGFPRDRDRRPDDRARAPRPPKADWQARPPREKPHGDALRRDAAPRFAPREGDRPRGPKGFPRDRDRRPDDRARAPRPPKADWQARPPREKPHGDKFAHKQGGDFERGGKGRDERDRGWRPRPPRDTPHSGKAGPRDDRSDRRFDTAKPGASSNRSTSSRKPDWRESLPRDSWRDSPREKPHGDKLGQAARRPFNARGGFDRQRPNEGERGRGVRNQGTDEPKAPPQPRGPNREPRPDENPEPSPPPRPSEPAVPRPGPPERGRLNKNRRSQR
jgi:hypothetical protein